MKYKREFIGELIGTFLLVLFGCGSVAVSVLFNAHQGLFQVALVWGIGVTLAIYATRHLSCAHLNPSVSVAMVLGKRMTIKRLPVYILAQFIGAFFAAAVLYMLLSASISFYENSHGIIRGGQESVKTAMMFGEYYPNPSAQIAKVSFFNAFGAEAFGTFLLVLLIFTLTEGCNVGRPDDAIAPVFIGLTVASIICLIAPLTQAGINPARDFGPRIFAWLAGWKAAAWPDNCGGFFFIYILAPLLGGSIASLFFVHILEPAMAGKEEVCNCKNNNQT
jgi:glycerol uptake facilitator protein